MLNIISNTLIVSNGMCSLDSRLMSLFVQNHNYLLLNKCQFIMSCFEYKRRFCNKLITKLTIIFVFI